MSFFTGAQGTVINGHVSMIANTSPQATERGFEILRQNTTASALDGSIASDPAKELGCLHGTRLEVQDLIVRWLNDPDGQLAMWMYGPAGIGKTAIAQTVAQLCEEKQQLSSTFFFFRSDEGRNSIKNLVPTLAYGMLQQMPHTREVLCTTTAYNPLIFSASLERQIKAIILPAISAPFPSPQNVQHGPMLFIIDGLDECADPRAQQSIIRLFISLLALTRTPIRHKILVVSRPESQIVSAFDAHDITPHVQHLCLDEWNSIADIEIFLRAELEAVKRTHPLRSHLAEHWPTYESFKSLLHKSFESFAYATSAIRYISSHDRHPDVSLNNLLGLTPYSAYEAHAELDSLYRHVLESLDDETCYIVLKIFCIKSWDLLDITTLDRVSLLIGEKIFTVELAIMKMSSVIRLDYREVFYYHTSFSDFLLDKERSGDLYLYSPRVGTAISEALISRLWSHPATLHGDDYYLSGVMVSELENIAVDMQIHILNTFLATSLPTSPVSFNREIGMFFAAIERKSRTSHHQKVMLPLFSLAFEHLAIWLSLLTGAGRGRNSDAILNFCFAPALQLQAFPPRTPEHILAKLVRDSDDPWCTIRRILPGYHSWKMCIALVKIYLTIPLKDRVNDWCYVLKGITPERFPSLPLMTILIDVLLSEPANAEICYLLEQVVSQAMMYSPAEKNTQVLITLYLSQDASEPAKVRPIDDGYGCGHVAEAMDLYVRKTHAELDLPYLSDNVKRLYINADDIERRAHG